jgi:hypothetical protein
MIFVIYFLDWWKSTGLDEKAGREEMMRRFGLVRERHSSASDDENCEEDEKEENDELKIGRKAGKRAGQYFLIIN